MRLFDFKCPEGHITEHLVEPTVTCVRCKCGQEATRIISPVAFHLDGSSQDWPSAHSKWVREHENAGKLHNT